MLIKATAARLREQKARTTFKWVKGHSGIEGNEKADKLADLGRQKNIPDIIDMTIRPDLLVTGAKLKVMTQSMAYKIIREIKMQTHSYQDALDRPATYLNIELACEAAGEHNGKKPPPTRIWTSIRAKDISRGIRYFLWMLAHDGYKVGQAGTGLKSRDLKSEGPARGVE